jgi:hypothetical protein
LARPGSRVQLAHEVGALERRGRVMRQGFDQPLGPVTVGQDSRPHDRQGAGGAPAGEQELVPGGAGGLVGTGLLDPGLALIDGQRRPSARARGQRGQSLPGDHALLAAEQKLPILEFPQEHGDRACEADGHCADHAGRSLGVLDVGQHAADLGEDLEVGDVVAQPRLALGLVLLADGHHRADRSRARVGERLGVDQHGDDVTLGARDVIELLHAGAAQRALQGVKLAGDARAGIIQELELRPTRHGSGGLAGPQGGGGRVGVEHAALGVAGHDGALQGVQQRPLHLGGGAGFWGDACSGCPAVRGHGQ